MKIAFLSPFYPYRGGIANFSDYLLSELRKEHQVKAFTFSRQYPHFLFPGSSQFVPDKDELKNSLGEKVLDSINPFTYGKTARLISENLPELVLISYWMPFFAPSLGWIARKLRKKNLKVVSILHNVIPHEKRFGDTALAKFYLKQSKAVVVLNEKSKQDLLSLTPGITYNVQNHPLYNRFGDKIDRDEAREKLNIPQNKKVLLFFGLIRDYKGLNVLIESMSRLDESYYLIIAGESYSDFTQYEEKIRKLNLENRIKLIIRYIPDSDVPLYFSASDVCVLPYLSGTQSGITGIAYNFDLPVIVTDVGGLKEMVEDGRTGFVVKEPTPMLMTVAIKMYFDGAMKEKFIPNIKEFKKAYSWERFASELINFAKKL